MNEKDIKLRNEELINAYIYNIIRIALERTFFNVNNSGLWSFFSISNIPYCKYKDNTISKKTKITDDQIQKCTNEVIGQLIQSNNILTTLLYSRFNIRLVRAMMFIPDYETIRYFGNNLI
jgi:hypothetical protein